MFNEYYYTEINQELVYCSIITLNNAVETSLYIGKRLVKRHSLQEGVHQLKEGHVELTIQITKNKVVAALKINDEVVEFQKLSRKEIGAKLAANGINNELNPEQKAKAPFNYRQFGLTLFLIILGVIWDVFTLDKGKYWSIPSMIILSIAYFQIFSPLLDRVPERYMDISTRGKFKLVFSVGGMILTQILVSTIIK